MTPIRQYGAYAYGLLAYVAALATVAYAVGFLANAVVPRSVDAGGGLPFGDRRRRYRRDVPMLVPRPWRSVGPVAADAEVDR